MKSICVYCGSSPGERPDYKAGAIALGNEMVKRGLTLVYGGGNVGLMGIVADAVLHGGNPVVGIIPKSLVRKEVGHKELTELHIVDSMHERKATMAALADGVIVLPGGFGTLDELFEAVTLIQTHRIRPFPVILVGSDCMPDPLRVHTGRYCDSISSFYLYS